VLSIISGYLVLYTDGVSDATPVAAIAGVTTTRTYLGPGLYQAGFPGSVAAARFYPFAFTADFSLRNYRAGYTRPQGSSLIIDAYHIDTVSLSAALVTAAAINALTLDAISITGGTITGTTLTTASSGARVVVAATTAGYIDFYDASVKTGSIYGLGAGMHVTSPQFISLTISGSEIASVSSTGMNVYGDLTVSGSIKTGDFVSATSDDGLWLNDAIGAGNYKCWWNSSTHKFNVRQGGTTYSSAAFT
jgi:hypothetical protein